MRMENQNGIDTDATAGAAAVRVFTTASAVVASEAAAEAASASPEVAAASVSNSF